MKKDETITTPFGKIPKYQDCNRCGAKLACQFYKVAYYQPCQTCRDSQDYQEERERAERAINAAAGMSDIVTRHQAAAVWTSRGRNIYTDKKGDVIKDEPYRPLKTGKQERAKKSFS